MPDGSLLAPLTFPQPPTARGEATAPMLRAAGPLLCPPEKGPLVWCGHWARCNQRKALQPAPEGA